MSRGRKKNTDSSYVWGVIFLTILFYMYWEFILAMSVIGFTGWLLWRNRTRVWQFLFRFGAFCRNTVRRIFRAAKNKINSNNHYGRIIQNREEM